MLLEFRVSNHKSIREEQVLSMLPEGLSVEDAAKLTPEELRARLLTVAAIYGANASGKSNVLDAMSAARSAVRLSFRSWSPTARRVPHSPFAWGEWAAKPSLYEFVILYEARVYRYGFEVSRKGFENEWLFELGSGERVFEREGQEVVPPPEREDSSPDSTVPINALWLSRQAQFRVRWALEVFAWFGAVDYLPPYGEGFIVLETSVARWLDKHADTSDERAQFLRLIRHADLGIHDILIHATTEERHVGDDPIFDHDGDVVDVRPRFEEVEVKRISFSHDSAAADATLPLISESRGTKALLRGAMRFIDALETGATVFADELESSLHSVLATELVSLFARAETNARRAQLIFATHDTNLLRGVGRSGPLAPENIWLVEKDAHGASHLYPLSEFQLGEGIDLERDYLDGRFGALPFVGELRRIFETPRTAAVDAEGTGGDGEGSASLGVAP